MTLSWIATELTTGNVITDVPGLVVPSISDTVGRYETATATLPVPTAPPDWERITAGLATCLHLIDRVDDDATPRVLWGGVVLDDERTEGDTVPISMATLPAYFDTRYVGTRTYSKVGQNAIVADLVQQYVASGSLGGIPIRVEIVNGGAGRLRDRTFDDANDKTVYSALTELMGLIDGPEWFVGWEWLHNPERITPVLYVGDRIGTAPAGPGPNATFSMPGVVTAFSVKRSYKAGKGANDVMATSSALADERPQSEHVLTPDPQRPTVEFRFTPSTSIVEVATLNLHARGKAALLADGASTIALTAAYDKAPALGKDWNLGDDVGYVLGGRDSRGRDTVPSLPGGREGVGRAIGWRIDFKAVPTITPILAGGDE